MNGFTLNEMYNELIDYWGYDPEAVDLVVKINGWSEGTLRDILFADTGERVFRCEEDEED
jgi:hypothetical protein